MDILHAVSSLEIGGAEKFVVNLAIKQQESGIDVGVVSYGEPMDPLQSLLSENSIKVFNLQGNILSRSIKLIKLLFSTKIFHIHSPAVIRACFPLFPLLSLKKVLYTIHGENTAKLSMMRLSHRIAKLYLNKTLAVSEGAKDSVAKRYAWSPDKIDVVKNGVPIRTIKNEKDSSIEGNILKIGIISRLIPLKNVSLLFDALNDLPLTYKKRYCVEVFGDGSDLNNLKSHAKNLNDCLIHFHGPCSNEYHMYSSVDLLVLCSNSEGLPMSILEAMSYGLPVVSTNVGAIPKVISHEINGFLYPPRNKEALKTILIQILDNPHSLINIKKMAQKYVLEHYSIDQVNRDYKHIYQKL